MLFNFGLNGNNADGGFGAALIMDANGNLYGTTSGGGAGVYGGGTVFELSPPSTSVGEWTESVLWFFGSGTDGNTPEDGLIMDSKGNLYGTARGGAAGAGVVFETDTACDRWRELDGVYPVGLW